MKKHKTIAKHILQRCFCSTIIFCLYHLANAQYIGGNGRGDIMAESIDFLFQTIYQGGNGRGDIRATIFNKALTGNAVLLWRGGVNGSSPRDWNTATNWVSEQIPAANDWIGMEPNGNGFELVLDQPRTVAELIFNAADKFVVLGAHELTLVGAANGANALNRFKTNGTGTVIKSIADQTSFLFPVGNSTYNPVTIGSRIGTNVAESFSVRVADEVLLGGTTGPQSTEPRVNRTWHIGKNPATQSNTSSVDFVFQWNIPNDEAGSISSYSLNHYNGTAWLFANSTGGNEAVATNVNTNTRTLTFTGYKGSFSPFAISQTTGPLATASLLLKGKAEQGEVVLYWKTLQEQGIQHFEIQRSTNGVHFTPIAQVAAAGNSITERNYAYRDTRPPSGTVYYRLRKVQRNGTDGYSTVVTMHLAPAADIWIGPVPASNELILQVPAQFNGTYAWRLHDAGGRIVLRGDGLRAGKQTVSIGHLSNGMYQMSIWEKGNMLHNQWIIKQ